MGFLDNIFSKAVAMVPEEARKKAEELAKASKAKVNEVASAAGRQVSGNLKKEDLGQEDQAYLAHIHSQLEGAIKEADNNDDTLPSNNH